MHPAALEEMLMQESRYGTDHSCLCFGKMQHRSEFVLGARPFTPP
jgi:hypothetical protein